MRAGARPKRNIEISNLVVDVQRSFVQRIALCVLVLPRARPQFNRPARLGNAFGAKVALCLLQSLVVQLHVCSPYIVHAAGTACHESVKHNFASSSAHKLPLMQQVSLGGGIGRTGMPMPSKTDSTSTCLNPSAPQRRPHNNRFYLQCTITLSSDILLPLLESLSCDCGLVFRFRCRNGCLT